MSVVETEIRSSPLPESMVRLLTADRCPDHESFWLTYTEMVAAEASMVMVSSPTVPLIRSSPLVLTTRDCMGSSVFRARLAICRPEVCPATLSNSK